MTPFMAEVIRVRGGGAPPPVVTVGAGRRSTAEATDTQVLLRSAAEQFVAEANAVLGDGLLDLTDRLGDRELAFTIGAGDRHLDVVTRLDGRGGTGHLEGVGTGTALDADSAATGTPELAIESEHDLAALVLHLLVPAPPRLIDLTDPSPSHPSPSHPNPDGPVIDLT